MITDLIFTVLDAIAHKRGEPKSRAGKKVTQFFELLLSLIPKWDKVVRYFLFVRKIRKCTPTPN
jgi:hypothetical protein